MKRGPNFVEREVFAELIAQLPTAADGDYKDINTLYGDMSRLVVACLASMSPEQLRALYHDFGWAGYGNARAAHLAARKWAELYHPGRFNVATEK